jgi:pimeloyl-ACP methyl ester carboxylesterase
LDKTQDDAAEKSSLSRAGDTALARGASAMKSVSAYRAIAGVLLCTAGAWLAIPTAYHEQIYFINAGGCRLATTILEKSGTTPQGSVVLFHGISANKKIMSYLAQGFAEQGLRVFAPDLPGHGRSPGPFSPARAEECGEALVRELLLHGTISPDRTIFAGHSMGGAIAVRIASHVQVAGLITISPAPMRATHGVSPEKLLFSDPPQLPPHSLVITGSLELESMRRNAADLAASRNDGTARYLEIPGATHVSVLFSSAVMRTAQEWSAQILQLPPSLNLPSHRPLVGALAGFAGLLLIAGPFLREVIGKVSPQDLAATGGNIGVVRLFLEFGVCSILVVLFLRIWIPLKVIGLFQGDYLASFLLILGLALTAVHWNAVRRSFASSPRQMISAAFAGLVLFLLITAWFDLTFYEAWLTPMKWARFPFLLAVLLPYHFAEETALGPPQAGKIWGRIGLALSLRLITWGALMAGVLILHSGEILMGLLAIYMALFNLIQTGAVHIVHKGTGSAGAAAIFGAILQAGFCLVIFPTS